MMYMSLLLFNSLPEVQNDRRRERDVVVKEHIIVLYFYVTHRLKQKWIENRERDVVVTDKLIYNAMYFYATHILK